MKQAFIDEAKQRLQALQQEYQQRIDAINNHIHHPPAELAEHWDDQAIITSQNEMRNNLKAEAEQGLNLVKAALARIDNNSYGICVDCGKAIELKRLTAVPYASKCMQHAK